ncbi:MAG: hypothetical protein ACREBU_22385, partial [Nitrososphaera sp.]
MTKQVNLKHVSSIVVAAATLAVVLTYVLGAQALLQSPYAEPGHEMFMSMYMPLVQGIAGHASQSQQMHGGSASQSQMYAGLQTQNQFGIIGNNILGSPAGLAAGGLAAGGLAAVVVMGVVVLAVVAFIISWKQRSFVVAGLLAASGIILIIPPLANMNFMFPGPIIGVIVGLGILGLGVAKSIRMARA